MHRKYIYNFEIIFYLCLFYSGVTTVHLTLSSPSSPLLSHPLTSCPLSLHPHNPSPISAFLLICRSLSDLIFRISNMCWLLPDAGHPHLCFLSFPHCHCVQTRQHPWRHCCFLLFPFILADSFSPLFLLFSPPIQTYTQTHFTSFLPFFFLIYTCFLSFMLLCPLAVNT